MVLYDREVGANTLNLLLENAKREAEEAERKFKSKLTNDISNKVVRSCLKSLPEGSDVEERCEAATNYKFNAKAKLNNKTTEVNTAQQKYCHLETECNKFNLINKIGDKNTILGKEQLYLKANEEELQSQQLEVMVLAKNDALLSAQSKKLESTDRIKTIESDLGKISFILSAYEDLFQMVKDLTLPELDWAPPSDNDIAARLIDFQEQPRQIRLERTKLDSTSKSIE